jgi:hypothetical protein
MKRSHAMTATFEETYRLKIVDFQYTPYQMQRIVDAAFKDGNGVDDGGRYDWRQGSSITVWTLPFAGHQVNTIKAIFRPVQVICIFYNALVRWGFQFFASLRLSWKERAHAQL